MSFEVFWTRIERRTPNLSIDDTKMTLSVGEFKRFLRKAHGAGYAIGKMEAATQKQRNTDNAAQEVVEQLFGGLDRIFGGKHGNQ